MQICSGLKEPSKIQNNTFYLEIFVRRFFSLKTVSIVHSLGLVFRPCAMVVPDIELICEIMLVAEGFLSAKLLARKFITLYTLCRELLSKQVRKKMPN